VNDEEPLSDEEIREVRRIIKAEQHMAWLRSSMRVWATYISAAMLTGFAIWKGLAEYLSIKVGLR
jgi:hypothetical protein